MKWIKLFEETKEALESIWKDVVMKKESWIITDFEWFKY